MKASAKLSPVLLLLALLVVTPAASAASKSLTIGLNAWAENIAVAHLWKHLLDSRGYHVKLTTAQEGVTWMGVARGQMQMSMDIWLPNTDAPYYKRYKHRVNLVGPWFQEAKLGLVVPQYSPVNTIAGLRKHAKDFKVEETPAILGTAPGDSEMKMTHHAIKAYHLPMKLIASSQAGMMAGLKRAYRHHRDIVVTLWSPHWAWAEYKLKYLKDPKHIYGKGDHIYVITETGFAHKYPKIQRWISHWHMSAHQLASLEDDIKKQGNAKGVDTWIHHNRHLIHQWIQ